MFHIMKKSARGSALCMALTITATAQLSLYFQPQTKLFGSGAIGQPDQGYSVAISGDGNTAIAGGPTDNSNAGAAWVYVRSNGIWTLQSKLVGTGALGTTAEQGLAVALSFDGNTALIGAPGDNAFVGAAWVFVRSAGVWAQQAKLIGTGAVGAASEGYSVALSSDGNTALLGGRFDNSHAGAAWVFVRSGVAWTQQGTKLVGTGATGNAIQGQSVALSGDGNTALVGGPTDNTNAGAAWVFVRSVGVWTQQGNKLVGTGAIALNGQGSQQGAGVALSSDGNTALVGGNSDNGYVGAGWVFTRSSGTWTQQGSKLVGSGANGVAAQGAAAALSGDGNTALLGGPGDNNLLGAAWIFKRNTGVWTQFSTKLVGFGGVGQSPLFTQEAAAVALASDGNTVLLGGPYDTNSNGAVWPFVFGPLVVPTTRDFRGIHRSDVLLYNAASGAAYTALSNGTGAYSYVANNFTPAFDTLRTGDFNGDGKVDVVVYNSTNALAYIGMSNGDGTFSFQSLFWSPGYTIVEAGDLNGDGKTDFILYKPSDGTMYAGISNADGTFSYRYNLVSPGYTTIRVADFTGDGKGDVLLYNSATGAANVGISDGAGDFTYTTLSVSPGYNLVDVGDLDGDGKADLILYNATNGNTATGISDGAGGFTFTPLIFSPGFTSVRLADYTGDGKADVTVYNKNNAAAYFGTGNGNGTFAFQSLFWSPGYDIVVPQDVSGDGKADVVLYNSATGTEYTGISNGTGVFSYTYQYWGIGRVLAR